MLEMHFGAWLIKDNKKKVFYLEITLRKKFIK